MKLLNILLGENDDFLHEREVRIEPFDKQIKVLNIVPAKFKSDVDALIGYIGENNFKSGLCIEVLLSQLQSIVPRTRRRADAYNALIKYLKDEHDINLIITPNRK